MLNNLLCNFMSMAIRLYTEKTKKFKMSCKKQI